MADEEPRERSEPGLLIADSDVLVRHHIADYLRRCGYMVIEAASYEEVLAVVEAGTLTIDLVLCDAELRGAGNGFALRARLTRDFADIRVILAGSVAAATEAAAGLCQEGPQLARPYDPQLVLERIRRGLALRNVNRP